MVIRMKIFSIIILIFLMMDITNARCSTSTYSWGTSSCGGSSVWRSCSGSGGSTLDCIGGSKWCNGKGKSWETCYIVIKNGRIVSTEGSIGLLEKDIIKAVIERQNSLLKDSILTNAQVDQRQKHFSEKIKNIYSNNCTLISEPPIDCETFDENQIKKELKTQLETIFDKKMKEVKKDLKKDDK